MGRGGRASTPPLGHRHPRAAQTAADWLPARAVPLPPVLGLGVRGQPPGSAPTSQVRTTQCLDEQPDFSS